MQEDYRACGASYATARSRILEYAIVALPLSHLRCGLRPMPHSLFEISSRPAPSAAKAGMIRTPRAARTLLRLRFLLRS